MHAMSDAERRRRTDALVTEIREGQDALSAPSPFQPFLNLLMTFVVETEYRLDKIEAALNGITGFEPEDPQLPITQVDKGQHG